MTTCPADPEGQHFPGCGCDDIVQRVEDTEVISVRDDAPPAVVITPATVPAGWYANPTDPDGSARYWNGASWAEMWAPRLTDGGVGQPVVRPAQSDAERAVPLREAQRAAESPPAGESGPSRVAALLDGVRSLLRRVPHKARVAIAGLVTVLGFGTGWLVAPGSSSDSPGDSTPPAAGYSAVCTRTGYSRAKFGNHPSSSDRKALEVLRTSPLGDFFDPYNGKSYPTTVGLDLDHVVPLGWAWDHGACTWPTQLRIMFATDPTNLVFTLAALNRSKGDQGPEDWLPPLDACGYWQRFTALATEYRLTLPPPGGDGHEKACPS